MSRMDRCCSSQSRHSQFRLSLAGCHSGLRSHRAILTCCMVVVIRWHYVLKPSITRQAWTEAEDAAIVHYQSQIGNKWSHIAKCLPGRYDHRLTRMVRARIVVVDKSSPSSFSLSSRHSACHHSLVRF